jgi:hypothetical protein
MALVTIILQESVVGLRRPVLVEQPAREIPTQISVTGRRNARVVLFGDESLAGSIDILKQHASIFATILLRKIKKNIGVFGNAAGPRVLGLGEVVGFAMNNQVSVSDFVRPEASVAARRADSFRKTERKVSNECAN